MQKRLVIIDRLPVLVGDGQTNYSIIFALRECYFLDVGADGGVVRASVRSLWTA